MIRVQRMFTELIDSIPVSHISQIFVIPGLDLLDLVGGTETVEEVDERNFALDSCQMSNRGQVHNFLYAGLTQHSAAGLTACIYIRVVAKDGQCMACKCTSRYIDNARKLLTGNLV